MKRYIHTVGNVDLDSEGDGSVRPRLAKQTHGVFGALNEVA